MTMRGLTAGGSRIIALFGGAVETGLSRGSGSRWAGLASAVTVVAASCGLCRLLRRWPRVRRWLVGRPVVLVHNGRGLTGQLRTVRLTEDDLLAALRRRGDESARRVRLAGPGDRGGGGGGGAGPPGGAGPRPRCVC